MQDKRAFAAHMERLAAMPDLARLLFGHGAPITDHPGDELRRVVAQLRA